MKKRIIDNWITSLVGVFIILASVYFYYIARSIAWEQFTVQIVFGLFFLRTKDTVLGFKPKQE